MPHVQQTTGRISADIRAAAQNSPDGGRGARQALFVVGFCFGGRTAFLSSILGLDLAGSIGFYGGPVGAGRSDIPAPVDVVGQMRNPILGLFGGADPGIPPESVAAFEDALTQAGLQHRLVREIVARVALAVDGGQAEIGTGSAQLGRRRYSMAREF